jgi:UDP-glucose 4-epimerase
MFEPFDGARVLITGGLGFIGSNLARRLAGQVSHLDSMQDPFTDLEINYRSQLYLLEACRQHNPGVRIVYTSTRQVYGRPVRLPVDEEHPLAPVDVNGIHKLAGGWYHILYHRTYGLRTTSLRLTNTYGPRMRVLDARQTFVGLWLRQLIEGKEIEVYGDGTQARDLNYVDDVVNAILSTAGSPKTIGGIYNLGSDEVISLINLARLLIELNGGGSFRFVPFPPDRKVIDVGDYYADYSRIQRALDWRPTIKLRDGLARTLAYYRANRAHYW